MRVLSLACALVLTLASSAHAASAACWRQTFEGDRFTVCRYAPDRNELRLAWRGGAGPLGDFGGLEAALGRDGRRLAFAMNAGMYDPSRRPVGLYVEAGRALRPLDQAAGRGNFYLRPNGVFWVDGEGLPHITETAAYAAHPPAARWATQSGPLLAQAGALHPAIDPNGASLAVRNGVGVKGGEALFVISDARVSFGRFARVLRDALGCPDVLYLDGAISSLWAPELRRKDARTGLGTFVVVLRRERRR